MIASFGCAETERIYRREISRRLPADIQKAARRRLLYLHEARDLRDLLAPPGNRLEPLKGNRAGRYSIRVNDQWRICFVWRAGGAYDVEIVDYH